MLKAVYGCAMIDVVLYKSAIIGGRSLLKFTSCPEATFPGFAQTDKPVHRLIQYVIYCNSIFPNKGHKNMKT